MQRVCVKVKHCVLYSLFNFLISYRLIEKNLSESPLAFNHINQCRKLPTLLETFLGQLIWVPLVTKYGPIFDK